MTATAVVICPGRGSYARGELGYLQRFHGAHHPLVELVDDARRDTGRIPVSELDAAARYRPSQHNAGNHAAALTYACALADFQALDREKVDVVAVTGNSMGWYLALAAAGATDLAGGFCIADELGNLMHSEGRGGQLVYPVCDDDWRADPVRQQAVASALQQATASASMHVSLSIRLGGFAVLAADEAGLDFLKRTLPPIEDTYPLHLPQHAAFHSALMRPVAEHAVSLMRDHPRVRLGQPELPLIDGCGHTWWPGSVDTEALFHYTFDTQICETFDYGRAVAVACRQFAPDYLVALGPGNSLGAATGQQLVQLGWRGINSKTAFQKQQAESPFLISMNNSAQRALVS